MLMTSIRPLQLAILTLCLALGGASSALAAPNSKAALAFFKGEQKSLRRLVNAAAKAKAPASAQRKLDDALVKLLDFDLIAARAIGEAGAKQDAAAQARFKTLLQSLVQANYRRNIRGTAGYGISYLGALPSDKTGEVRVQTRAKSNTDKRAPAVMIGYDLREDGKRWRVTDVRTDGVSMVDNYRKQFNRILKKEGWDALLKRMQQKLDALQK